MRALLSTLAAIVVASSGCLPTPARTLVHSESATKLHVTYTGEGERVSAALLDRGCVPEGTALVCDLESGGVPYQARVWISDPSVTRLPGVASGEAAKSATEGADPYQRAAEATEQGRLDAASESSVGTHEMERARATRGTHSAGQARLSRLGSTTRVTTADGNPVLLGGAGAQSLRDMLYELVVRDLPVTKAYYTE